MFQTLTQMTFKRHDCLNHPQFGWLITLLMKLDNFKSPSPINGPQDLHTNLLCIGDSAFLGYQIKMNWINHFNFEVQLLGKGLRRLISAVTWCTLNGLMTSCTELTASQRWGRSHCPGCTLLSPESSSVSPCSAPGFCPCVMEWNEARVNCGTQSKMKYRDFQVAWPRSIQEIGACV